MFSHAPVTSVNSERTFSKLKKVLTNNRTRLTEKHIRDVLLVQWNRILIYVQKYIVTYISLYV